jgi:hypothetical protein
MAAPYCERYYCDSAFANILKNNVQGRKPPTAYQLVKKLYAKGLITQSVYREKKQKRSLYDQTYPMLDNTLVYRHPELVKQVTSTVVS